MHTLITGWPYVDHQDHDGLNNRRIRVPELSVIDEGVVQR